MLTTNDALLESLTAINDAFHSGVLAGVAACQNCKRLESENRELKDHVKHLEASLAAVLSERVGMREVGDA